MYSTTRSSITGLLLLAAAAAGVLAIMAQRAVQFVAAGLAQSRDVRVVSENACSADSSAHFTGCSSIL